MAFRSQYPVIRDSAGKQTNAADATVHADSGAIAANQAGLYDVKIVVGGSVAIVWTVQFRNPADSANVGDTHTVYSAAGQSAEFVIANVPFDRNNDGLQTSAVNRVRVVNDGAITGTSAASVFLHRAN